MQKKISGTTIYSASKINFNSNLTSIMFSNVEEQEWVQCDRCERWRKSPQKYSAGKLFVCKFFYEEGCSYITEDFFAFCKDERRNLDRMTLDDATSVLRDNFGYLLDRLPKSGAYKTYRKDWLKRNIDSCNLEEIHQRLLLIQCDLVDRFKVPDWKEFWKDYHEIYVGIKTTLTPGSVFDLGWTLEENIDWDKVFVSPSKRLVRLVEISKNIIIHKE